MLELPQVINKEFLLTISIQYLEDTVSDGNKEKY